MFLPFLPPNMKHRATSKQGNKTTDINQQTWTDNRQRGERTRRAKGTQIAYSRDPEPKVSIVPGGAREEAGRLPTSSCPQESSGTACVHVPSLSPKCPRQRGQLLS